jgi:predicted RNase H-like HicB family nuclease
MAHYIALIHKDADSDYGVSFPDFPGCISAGTTMDEAIVMGREALDGHIRLMVEDGEIIPEPSTMDAVLLHPENQDGAPVLIAGPKLATKRYV